MSVTTITPEDLALHAQWLADPATGVRIVRIGANLRGANLQDANLQDANLRVADLRVADLQGANLQDADLRGANLRGANLRGANLQDANLRGANLQGANLWVANLQVADLRGADLRGANLRVADLRGADLQGADLRGANLQGANLWVANLWVADLRGADLQGADLRGANLNGATGLPIAEDAPERLLAAARAALQPGALNMRTWHTCETTHCLSGWAVHQAGKVGKVLEAVVGNHMAGLYLLGTEAAGHFYDTNEKATEYLRGVLAAAAESQEGQSCP